MKNQEKGRDSLKHNKHNLTMLESRITKSNIICFRTLIEVFLKKFGPYSRWLRLNEEKFGGNSKVKKSLLNSLRREFEILTMKRDETITVYFEE